MGIRDNGQFDRLLKVLALIVSLLVAALGIAYGYGTLSNRVTEIEKREASFKSELRDMRSEFREDLRYIRERLDERAGKEKSK